MIKRLQLVVVKYVFSKLLDGSPSPILSMLAEWLLKTKSPCGLFVFIVPL